MGGRNGIQTDTEKMKEKIRERWKRDPIEVFPENARPNVLAHHLVEETFFLSSTGITFEDARQALQNQQTELQSRNPGAHKRVSGWAIRKIRQQYQQSQQGKSRAADANVLDGITAGMNRNIHQQQIRNQDPDKSGKRVVPAALIRRAAFKTTPAKTRTKHVYTSSRSRWKAVQGYHEQKQRFEALVEVKVSEGKGRGWFAASDIPQGTQIYAEKPLIKVKTPYKPTRDIAIRQALDRLSLEDKKTFKNLSSARKVEDDMNVAKFNTNCFAWDLDSRIECSGVFAMISLLNHDCQPNALVDVDSATSIAQTRAIVNIEKGSEITIQYDDDDFWRTAKERQENLRMGWQFDCACSTCKSEDREAARQTLRQLAQTLIPKGTRSSHVHPELLIDNADYREYDPTDTLRRSLAYVETMTGQGITGTRMARAYNMAARLLERAGRLEEALDHLRATQRINLNCFGRGNPVYHEQEDKIRELEARIQTRCDGGS